MNEIKLEIPAPKTELRDTLFFTTMILACAANIAVWAYATGHILNSLNLILQ